MSERIIEHFKFGKGTVKKLRNNGFELFVEFEIGFSQWVRFDDVQEISTLTSRDIPLPKPTFSAIPKSRRLIENLRLGIVPYDCVDAFTFGRSVETNQILNWLKASENSTLILVGEYGAGKSHLLHYAHGRALQEGFAVAIVEIDPNERPFHKPKRIYGSLVRTLSYIDNRDGQIKGFRDLIKEALSRNFLRDHIYFLRLIGKSPDESRWEWIEARESLAKPIDNSIYTPLPGLYDYTTAANIYCYLLSGLGWTARTALKLKGLLLLFDEAESLEMSYYQTQFDRGLNFLKALIRTADNDESLLKPPNNYYGRPLI